VPGEHLALQIMLLPAADRAGLNAFLRATREAIGLAQVHAYPLKVGDRQHIAIIYGNFRTRAQAEAVQALLAEQGPFPPQLREVGAIRAEVRDAGAGW
jgi:MSHA biogenesis protein MshM